MKKFIILTTMFLFAVSIISEAHREEQTEMDAIVKGKQGKDIVIKI